MKIIKKAVELLLVSCLATIVATGVTAYMLDPQAPSPKIILASLQQTPHASLLAPPSSQGRSANTDVQMLSRQELARFVKIIARVKREYVDEVDDKILFENAIQGVLGGLDRYSTLLDSESFSQFKVDAVGEFGGLGIDVSFDDGFLSVADVKIDGPADRSGVLRGDRISHIEGQSLAGRDLKYAVTLLRGKPGSAVALSIQRIGEPSSVQITAIRELIALQSVDLISQEILGWGASSDQLREGHGSDLSAYAFLRINKFQSATAEDLRTELRHLVSNRNAPLKGLVIDLRGNPGGLLRGAIQVSDLFLENKTIVSTKGRIPQAFSEHLSNNVDILKGAPIVILVDDQTASSSEIVTAALQDNDRAIVVGQTTFGKGIVQTITAVDKSSALKMTTAKYYTPDGRSIHGVGVVPDVVYGADESQTIEIKALELLKSFHAQG